MKRPLAVIASLAALAALTWTPAQARTSGPAAADTSGSVAVIGL